MTALRQRGYKVKFYDLQIIGDINSLETMLAADSAKIILFSTISMMLPWLFQSIKKIKAMAPCKNVILGGPGIALIAEDILRQYEIVDYIIEGEGEIAVADLIRALNGRTTKFNLQNVRNLVYKQNNCIVRNSRTSQRWLGKINTLDYSDVLSESYTIVSSVVTSYGCTYDCSFCYSPSLWGRRIVTKPIKVIFKDVKAIFDTFQTKYIVFVDDLFFLHKERSREFFRAYYAGGCQFKYLILGGRVDVLDKEILEHLRDTNCISISFGLESASNRILKKISKRFKVEQALDTITMAKRYVHDISVSFIVGFPFETLNEFCDTIELGRALDRQGYHIILNYLRPQVGSSIYMEYLDKLYIGDFRYVIKPYIIDHDIDTMIRGNAKIFAWYYSYNTFDKEEKYKVFSEHNIKYIPIHKRINIA